MREWQIAETAEPDIIGATRTRLRTRPMDRSDNPRRTGPLHGKLATRRVGDQTLPQWQHEMTGSGRVWYCPDRETQTVWVTKIGLSHPKETD